MKKLLSTLALVLAISSVSMANTVSKKMSHKKVNVKVTFFCDSNNNVVGAIASNGTVYGEVCGCVCKD